MNMLYFLMIENYFKILTDVEVKDFVTIDLSEYFQSVREE